MDIPNYHFKCHFRADKMCSACLYSNKLSNLYGEICNQHPIFWTLKNYLIISILTVFDTISFQGI